MTLPQKTTQTSVKDKLSHRWKIRSRLILSIIFALTVSFLLPSIFSLSTRILCIWDAGMISFLVASWVVMMRAKIKTMRRNAQSQDEGRAVILGLIIAAASSNLLAIAFILREAKGQEVNIVIPHVSLAIVTIIGSWLLIHTIFAMHYAHEYYQDHPTQSHLKAGGLDFPDDVEPDYWDFLYFSFVIGMTSQVSDVPITSRSLRRLALMHSILSFFYNTAIVAMSINIIAGLIG